MSKIWLPGGGGGGAGSDDCTIILSDVPRGLKAVTGDSDDEAGEGTLDTVTTAADSHVLAGETYMKFNTGTKHWEKRTGGQANRGAWTGSVGMNSSVTVPAGNHNGSGKVNGPAVTQRGAWTSSVGMNGSTAVPEGYHNGSGKVNGPAVTQRGAWATNIGINGKAAIPEGYHNGSGYVGQSLATKGAQTYTPGRTNQVIAANQYLTGAQTIAGDANLLAANIKKNVSIMGIIGSFQGYSDSPLYLFNNGAWSNLQTPGMTNTMGIVSSLGKTCIQTSPNYDFYCRLNQSVNLTNYNYIKIESNMTDSRGYATYGCGIHVSRSANLTEGPWDSFVDWDGTTNSFFTGILNVSSLSGFYYIYYSIGYIWANNTRLTTDNHISSIFLTTT